MTGTRDAGPDARTDTGAGALDPVADDLRNDDPDRFYTALFADEPARSNLMALYAWNLEVARNRERVSEPMLGQIRLQWWREALDDLYAGTVRVHPVAEALARWFERSENRPPRDLFERILDARERDLEDEPFAELSDWQDYAAVTGGDLLQLALHAAGGPDLAERAGAAAKAAGTAYAMTGLVRAIPFAGAMGRVLVPLSLIRDAGFRDPRALAARQEPGRTREIVSGLCGHAGEMLAGARRAGAGHTGAGGAAARPVLLHRSLTSLYLGRITRADYDFGDPRLDIGNATRIGRLFWRNLIRRP